MKREYYNIKKLLDTNAEYMMLLGKRANGKSYQCKLTVIKEAMEGKKFIYLRRYVLDIKANAVESYFDDMPISKLTKGEWMGIRAIKGSLYFVNVDVDTGKIVDREEIGRYCALSEAIRYKSQVFKGYSTIIYEEFITDEMYLPNEPTKLQQFVSTIFRLDKGKVLLVGNTLSRVCPYFAEWSLEGVLKQKQGTIDIYNYHVSVNNEDSVIHVAVEQCANTKNENTMFFGDASKQILTGEWDVHSVPKLPKALYEYDMVYEVEVDYQAFKFVMQLLVEPIDGGKILYVYPKTSDREIYRIISDVFSDKPNITRKLDVKRKPEEYMLDCLRLEKVCFSDNLTGSDFAKVREGLRL